MNYIVTKPLKNKGLAVFLVVIFGSLGLFYSSIIGGILMTLLFPILVIIVGLSGHIALAIFLSCMYYIICIIWAINGINDYNRDLIKYSSQYTSQYSKPDREINTTESYVSPYSYYTKKDSSVMWLLLTIILLFAIVGGYLYVFKN